MSKVQRELVGSEGDVIARARGVRGPTWGSKPWSRLRPRGPAREMSWTTSRRPPGRGPLPSLEPIAPLRQDADLQLW